MGSSSQIAVLVAILLAAGTARAAGPTAPGKLAYLAAKAAAPAPTGGERAAFDRRLQGRVRRTPKALINVRNRWSHEVLVLESDPNNPVEPALFDLFLRCHFTDEIHPVDPRLAKLLVQASEKFGKRRIEVVSGFRAAKYQLVLRKKGHEVARDSQHSKGNAIDFLVPGVPTQVLHDWVQAAHLGGVGLYLGSGFVHADTGPVRHWTGY